MRQLIMIGVLLLAGSAWAGRTFTDLTNLEAATAVVTAAPATLCAWAYPTSAEIVGIVGVGVSGSNNNRLTMLMAASRQLQAVTRDGTTEAAATSGVNLLTLNAWNAVCAIFTSAASRQTFLNGALGTAETTSITPAGLNRTWVARYAGFTTALEFVGTLATVGIWNEALTLAELQAFGTGQPPNRIRPHALVACPRLMSGSNPEVDECAARSWALTGSPTVSTFNPPVGLWTR